MKKSSANSAPSRGGRPDVLVICGYFDTFSGYNEISLVKYLSKRANVTVCASNRASSVYSKQRLLSMGVGEKYGLEPEQWQGAVLHRFECTKVGSVFWSMSLVRWLRSADKFDLVVQLSPGQVFSAAGAFIPRVEKITIFPDNSAMWAHIKPLRRFVKGIAFSCTKGLVYRLMCHRSNRIYGYTPNTLLRIGPYARPSRIELMPLSFDPEFFYFDESLRHDTRADLGLAPTDFLIIAPGKAASNKRLELLVEMLERLCVSGVSAKLLLVGLDDDDYSRHLSRVALGSHMAQDIVLRGFISGDELNALLNAADLGVWPFVPGITIQQAMASGLRVLVPLSDVTSHLIEDELAGRGFPPGDLERIIALVAQEVDRVSEWHACRNGRAIEARWMSAPEAADRLLGEVGTS